MASEVGEREAGWVAEPAADEFNNLRPNRAALEEIAAKTGGEVIAPRDLNRFVADLPSRSAPITEPRIRPAWHHPLVLSGDNSLPLRRMGPPPLEGAAVTLLTTKTQRARRVLRGTLECFGLCVLCVFVVQIMNWQL